MLAEGASCRCCLPRLMLLATVATAESSRVNHDKRSKAKRSWWRRVLLVEQLVHVERREQRCCSRHCVVGARAVQEKTAIHNTQLCKGRTRDDIVATSTGRRGGGSSHSRESLAASSGRSSSATYWETAVSDRVLFKKRAWRAMRGSSCCDAVTL